MVVNGKDNKNGYTHELLTRIYTGLLIVFVLVFLLYYASSQGLILFFALLLSMVLLYEWPYLMPEHTPIIQLLSTLVYPVFPFCCLMLLSQVQYRGLLALLFLLVFAFDTGSYLIGKRWGIYRICPTISPKKTWEGFLGGAFTVFICISLYAHVRTCLLHTYTYVFLTLGISILALSGDLFESWLKRRAQVKDSGILLPGHGGILDRFDSILFVSVAAYYLRSFLCALLCV